jgi:hypothetical protein
LTDDIAILRSMLDKQLGVHVVGVRCDRGIWAVALAGGRLIALGDDAHVLDHGALSSRLRAAGAKPAKFTPATGRSTLAMLQILHDEGKANAQ